MTATLPVKINRRKVKKNQTEKASLGDRTNVWKNEEQNDIISTEKKDNTNNNK